MTQDEILAALREVVAANNQYTTWTVSTPHLVALVNLAIEREREACAKVCETLWNTSTNGMATEEESYGAQCAEAIRARGQA
jgi:hypothetical protein